MACVVPQRHRDNIQQNTAYRNKKLIVPRASYEDKGNQTKVCCERNVWRVTSVKVEKFTNNELGDMFLCSDI